MAHRSLFWGLLCCAHPLKHDPDSAPWTGQAAKSWKDLGMRRVTISAPAASCARLAVVLAPAGAEESWVATLRVNPLGEWPAAGPLGSQQGASR